jgi:hypothetical protein
MMCIYKSWANDLVPAVDDLCSRRRLYAWLNPRNNAPFDQEVCFHRFYVIIMAMDKESPSLEKDRSCHLERNKLILPTSLSRDSGLIYTRGGRWV